MTKLYKAALLAALGLASVASVKAQDGELIVGLTTKSGTDLIYDLGTQASLVNGETWSLGTVSSAVNWGVIGDTFLGNPQKAWTTASSAPAKFSGAVLGDIDTAISSIFANVAGTGLTVGKGNFVTTSATSDLYSWNNQIYNPTQETDYGTVYGVNPNATGFSTINFYGTTADAGTSGSLLGTFGLNSTGTLTFNTVAVPEPGTYGLIAGAGLLVVSLRNQLRRKQA